ncbi:MAG: hypothetical protein JF606_00315 [Burkholderiales bacterium]|nr:hypothetical protein [Burkholderiales bacterium]
MDTCVGQRNGPAGPARIRALFWVRERLQAGHGGRQVAPGRSGDASQVGLKVLIRFERISAVDLGLPMINLRHFCS